MNNNVNTFDLVAETKTLAHALTFANSVVEKRNIASEIANIRLSTKGNMLQLEATDMTIYLSQTIGAQIFSEGQITVSTNLLNEIVRKIPDGTVKLYLDQDQLKISASNCSFSVMTLPVENFPNIDNTNFDLVAKLPIQDFAKILEYTHFSISTDDTRYNLSGIYLHSADGKLCATSIDGHRLSFSSVAHAAVSQLTDLPDFNVILPRKTVHEMLKITRDKNLNQDLEIFLGKNKIKFVYNNIFMLSKLVDATFPEYHSFIPKDNENKLRINAKLFANAIDRIAIITVDKFRSIKLKLQQGSVEISAQSDVKGSAKEIIPCSEDVKYLCKFSGINLSLSLNPQYLLDILNVIKSENVELLFKDSFSGVLIRSENSEDDIFIVMPVKA